MTNMTNKVPTKDMFIYSATSDVERQFSKMNLIHQSAQRNAMGQETPHLHIKSGIQNSGGKTPHPHCHCRTFEVTQDIRDKCKESYKVVGDNSRKVTAEKKEELEKNIERREKRRGLINLFPTSTEGKRSGRKKF